MKAVPAMVVFALLWVADSGGVYAQGLGDVAARERARRAKSAADQGRSFTNQDLEKGRPAGAPAPAAAAETSPAAAESSGPADEPDAYKERQEAESGFVRTLTEAQQRLSALERRAKELSDKLNPMSGSYIFGATGSNDLAEDARVREELSSMQAALSEARNDVAAANEALREARRSGRSGREGQ
ncbi:MAG: hypothetical protein U0599_04570 [Vicinamibacteria bacterium]